MSDARPKSLAERLTRAIEDFRDDRRAIEEHIWINGVLYHLIRKEDGEVEAVRRDRKQV